MKEGLYLSSVSKILAWARKRSLWYYSVGQGCCADELLESVGCRYDLERFGCLPQSEPSQADLLIVTGSISQKSVEAFRKVYDSMLEPKYVLAVGACACTGGLFGPGYSYSVVPGVREILPVDVYVPGCPPRPEAIMNGIIALQEKIGGRRQHQELD